MSVLVKDTLLRQLDTAWALASHHLAGLTDAEYLWRPARAGLHVWQDGEGGWRADWPEHEGYDLGPPSIGWTSWHLIMWWTRALESAFGDPDLAAAPVMWPGSADGVRRALQTLHDRWRTALAEASEDDLASTERVLWPFRDRTLADLFAWANIELTKNAAEIGYARFLFAVRDVG